MDDMAPKKELDEAARKGFGPTGEPDLDEMAAKADSGDESAQQYLTRLGKELGIGQSEVDDLQTWEEVAILIKGRQAVKAKKLEAQAERVARGGRAAAEDEGENLVTNQQQQPKKKPLKGLTRDNPATPEGKYLVVRRDGTVPKWPSFVLGAADPVAEVGLRAYALEVLRIVKEDPEQAEVLGLLPEFGERLLRYADEWKEYREKHGQGDPGMGPHRKDDPATIAKMREGQSA
jgi:hypothetical protein